jgi:mycofactocin glycosyltransferase
MISASVVIPAFNAEATIGDTLHAILNQTNAPSNLEVIVVDNESSDATRDVVRHLSAITLLSESTRGPAAARNRGLHCASNDVVVHLDADTLPARTWLRNLLAPFSSPTTMIAAGRTLCFTPTTGVERYIAGAGLYETERAITRLPFPFAPSLNMAVRRSAALAVGGWTEQLATAEDVDFSHRILKQYPGDIAYAREAVLFHRVRSTPEELVALAQSYGQGVARMYLRYPDEVQWDVLKTAKTNARIAIRAVESGMLSLGRALSLTSAEKAEFSHFHFIWSRHFARGFYDVYYRSQHEV